LRNDKAETLEKDEGQAAACGGKTKGRRPFPGDTFFDSLNGAPHMRRSIFLWINSF
jgi:hypothetical protein